MRMIFLMTSSDSSTPISSQSTSKCRKLFLIITITCCYLVVSFTEAFDNEDQNNISDNHQHHTGPIPKDKLLLKAVDKLVFHRNKRTTSRRTHSIPQLSCVGGTAGCKLFTPNAVECEKVGFDQHKSKYDWRCHAEMSEQVKFNHVEVICEGYDYPEDDYILLGSCGLEFTLDYADPTDHHPNSYFRHMDEHEKKLFEQRTGMKQTPKVAGVSSYLSPSSLIRQIKDNLFLSSLVGLLGLSFLVIIVRYYFQGGSGGGSPSNGSPSGSQQSKRQISYGPLTSAAVLSTKKAC